MVVVQMGGKPTLAVPAVNAVASSLPSTAPDTAAGIKVGLILSYRTATEASWSDKPYGYNVQVQVLEMLDDPGIVLIPVVESGSETQPGMPTQLRRYFPGRKAIDGGDAAALQNLDVIVASATWRTTDSVVNAVETAVKSGVGIINGAGMGVEGREYSPDHPAVAHVAGLTEGLYAWNGMEVPCKVLTTHPLLGTLAEDAVVHMAPNGAYGILPADAIPLIGLTDPAQSQGP